VSSERDFHATESEGPLAGARKLAERGDYARVVEITRSLMDDPEASALHIRALANLDVPGAERATAEAVGRHPLCCELHYLRAALLAELGRLDDACASARRVVYLDRSLAIGHLFLGTLLARRGNSDGARRHFRNARELFLARPADEPVRFADGQTAGSLADEACNQLAQLDLTLAEPAR
jgi:Flp pilus assembly protein TadD